MERSPKLLWKKESTETNAFFVDIFEGVRSMEVYDGLHEANTNQKFAYVPKKDNELSLTYRKQGNQLYILKNYKKAIEMYNKSLCHAEIASEHVSFAFGNRSLCFYEMEMFEECLTDIQFAKDANYPESLMYKLDNRKANCLARIDVRNVSGPLKFPILSFKADAKIPGLANILKINHNNQFGRHIVTDSDIEVNQTIMVEKSLTHVLIGSEYSRCSNCFKENMNFIACKKCTDAMFCDENCENNPYHRYECDLYKLFGWETDGFFRNNLQLIVRLVLMGVNLTSTLNVDELMQLVAGCTNIAETSEVAIAKDTDRSKFETLLKLSHFTAEKDSFDFSLQMACLVYDLLLERPEIRRTFSTVTHRRFLMHLTVYFAAIFKTNRVTLEQINPFSALGEPMEHFGLGIYNLRSYLNHACAPNVVCLSYGNILVCKAIAQIKKGEQLFIDYFKTDVDAEKTVQRDQLKDVYGFLCNCRLCLLNSETLPSNAQMNLDSNFLYVKQNFETVMMTRNQNLLNELKEKSIQFLKQWGRTQPCIEVILMQQYFSVFSLMLGL